MRTWSTLPPFIAVLATVLVLTGCGTDESLDETAPPSLPDTLTATGDTAFERLYVGVDRGGDAFVAVGWRGDEMLGYLCDGHGLGLWFSGTAEAELRHASGVTLSVQSRNGDRISGRVEGLGSGVLLFELPRAGRADALIRLEPVGDDAPPSGLIISDLAIKGAVVTGGGPSVANPTVTVPAGGSTGSSSASGGSSGGAAGAEGGAAAGASTGSTTGAQSGGNESVSGQAGSGQSGSAIAIQIPPPSIVTPPVSVTPLDDASAEVRACRAKAEGLSGSIAGLTAQLAALRTTFGAQVSQLERQLRAAKAEETRELEARLATLRSQRDAAVRYVELRVADVRRDLGAQTQTCDALESK